MAARIEEDCGKLDVLVNKAGIADPHDGPPSRVNVDVIERVLRANFLGAVAMAQAVLPLLRKSGAGWIVNVSSDLGSITTYGDPTWTYAQVKVCLANCKFSSISRVSRSCDPVSRRGRIRQKGR